MLGLARESDDLSLGLFALRYILEAVDGTDNVSIAIPDCLDVNERDGEPGAWCFAISKEN
jgi:hypothetical protein